MFVLCSMSATIDLYTVLASLADILPKCNGQPLPATLPKGPHFTRKHCTVETENKT